MIAAILCRIFGHTERRLAKKELNANHPLAALSRELAQRKRVCRRCGHERFTRPRKKDQQ